MSSKKKHIVICSTSIANYDRRIQRISYSLHKAGYQLTWMCRVRNDFSLDYLNLVRIRSPFQGGFLFYAWLNLVLFFKLLFRKADAICAVDLDTALAAKMVSVLTGRTLIFDAHEYFTEVPELTGRNFVKSFWSTIANWILPRIKYNYTVGSQLANKFSELYHVSYETIRNTPVQISGPEKEHIISNEINSLVYLGVINKGRGLEIAIEALTELKDCHLTVLGDGDLFEEMKQLSKDLKVDDRIKFLGFVQPENISKELAKCQISINLLSADSKSYYYSLANKYFDYINAGLPCICMNYPEYKALNEKYGMSILIDDYTPNALIEAVRNLQVPDLYSQLQKNTISAAKELHWAIDEARLVGLYKQWLR